jgi:hypothetical protein
MNDDEENDDWYIDESGDYDDDPFECDEELGEAHGLDGERLNSEGNDDGCPKR